MVIANRTLARAQSIAAEVKGYAVDLTALDKELAAADIVVSCTASTLPLVTEAAVSAAIRTRRHRPILMVDLAVPRDIEPAVADLSDCISYPSTICNSSSTKTDSAASWPPTTHARCSARRSPAFWPILARTMRPLRSACCARSADAIRQHTLDQAKRMLAAGRSSEEVIDFLANTLTNRLLHTPMQALRQAAESDGHDLAQALRRLLMEERGRQ